MEKLNEIIQKTLEQEHGLVSIHLFGSQAKGTTRKWSDVDIALLYQYNSVPDRMHQIQMQENLSEKLESEVDLVYLNEASPIIGREILKHGKELKINHQKEYDQYVIRLLTEYADLKRMRKPLEEKILERKFYTDS